MTQADQQALAAQDPWQRYGWWLWATWLIFLVFPAGAVLASDRSSTSKAAGIAVVLVFAAVYAWGSRRLAIGQGTKWLMIGLLIFLSVLALSTAPVIGLGALGFTPFIQSFGMFALPRPWNWALAAGLVGLALLLPLLDGSLDEWFFFVLILIAVGGGTGAGRLMADRGEEYSELLDQVTVTNERERVARDVHDVLGHSLTVVTVKAELAERLVDIDPERAKSELADIQHLTRQALSEIRATVGGLRAARLDDELESARVALDGAGIEAEIHEDASVVDPRYRTVMAWALREAITNVVRHSQANRCLVRLGTATLRVSDDGCGQERAGFGNGLRGLQERVTGAGGSLRVEPGADGAGTTVEVSW